MTIMSTKPDQSSSSDDIDEYPERQPKRRKLSFDADSDEEETRPTKELGSNSSIASRVKPRVLRHAEKGLSPMKQKSSKTDGTMKKADIKSVTFSSLGLDPWLTSALSAMQITVPTPIQIETIPPILAGDDCIGGSKTGSGKTVAFAAPILQKWAEDGFGVFALILTPTRELALQIYEQIRALSASSNLKPLLITGGSDMRAQAISLATHPHVVIATPGRLADHIASSGDETVAGLRRARFVVLDEADRLLKPGYGSLLPDVDACLAMLPPPEKRQTLLFTATITPEVAALKARRRQGSRQLFVSSAAVAAVSASDETDGLESGTRSASTTVEIPVGLKQTYLLVPATHREVHLHVLLSLFSSRSPLLSSQSRVTEESASAISAEPAPEQTLVFTNHTRTASYLEHLLRLLTHRVTSLHSALPQRTRTSNLARFRARAADILVATDVAARGLDIPTVGMVVNYELPRDADDYVHRVGRTARAGRGGLAVSFVGPRDVELVQSVESRVGMEMSELDGEGLFKGRNVRGEVEREGVLKLVGEKRREAVVRMEEGRDVKGNRTRGLKAVRSVK